MSSALTSRRASRGSTVLGRDAPGREVKAQFQNYADGNEVFLAYQTRWPPPPSGPAPGRCPSCRDGPRERPSSYGEALSRSGRAGPQARSIREVDKRTELIEDELPSRTQVVGIVTTSMVAAIGAVASLLAIFK